MLNKLKNIVGPENVDEETRRCFPINREQVVEVVKCFYESREKIRVVSTDNNWGYNTFIKNNFPGFTINLNKMNRIIDFDDELGVVTIEPGVTQGQLKEFLDKKGANLIVPTTGAGPSCSMIGNALERGYGLTAYYDSFASCMSLEGVWPNGETYRSPLINLGGNEVSKIYKWGVGPFFDGLFAQSDYGICTSMSFALKRKPSGVMGVMFQLNHSPANLVPPIRQILQAVGGIIGPIKITNQHRISSIIQMAPQFRDFPSPLALNPRVMEFFAECGIPAWLGSFALYTDALVLPSVKKLIEKILKPHVDSIRFIEEKRNQHPQEAQFLGMATGTPGDGALNMVYFRAPNLLEPHKPFSPEKDGAGILWFAPLIPAKKESVQEYLISSLELLNKYNFEPAISLTSLSDRCFDSALALLFNGHDDEAIARAKKCYEELFASCKAKGFVPYRLPHSFDYLVKDDRLKTEAELMKVFGRNV